MLNVTITRYRKLNESIDGRLTIDGEPVCDTAENFYNALPAGVYQIIIDKCRFHARKMPLIVTSKGGIEVINQRCTRCAKTECVGFNSSPHKGGVGGGLLCCPMLKPGNGVHNRRDGSIIVGEFLVAGCLSHPKQAFDTLYERLRKSAQRGHEIRLTIEENYMTNPHGTFDLGTKAIDSLSGRKLNL